MHIGVSAQSTDRTLDAATIARTVEAAGVESVFFGEHTHIPAARETPYPGAPTARSRPATSARSTSSSR